MAEQTQDGNALMSSFGLDMSNLLPKTSGKKSSSTQDALSKVVAARANVASQEAQFEGQKALSKAETEKTAQKKISDAATTYAKIGEDSEELKKIDELEKKSIKEFAPTQENAQDLSTLFGLTTLIGFALGGAGKKHAMQAMSAMNGMLEGHRLGRDDLYKKEKYAYEANQKALKTQIDMLTNRFKLRMEQGARDLTAATEAAKTDALEAGASFIAQHVSQFGLNKTSEYLNGLQNLLVEQQKHQDNLADKAQAKQDKLDQISIRNQFQRELEDLRFKNRVDLANAKVSNQGQKPPAKEIVNANNLRNNLIPKVEEAIPVLDRLNKEGKWSKLSALMAVDSRLAEYEFQNDPQALDLILSLAYFRSKEFETAGKALTKNEDKILAPIVRGDLRVYQGLRNALTDGLSTMKHEQAGLEATYPYIRNVNASLRGEPEPAQAPTAAPPSTAQAPKYTLGQRIVKGNKTYEIIGLSNPNDPDVREVK
jgi:hypothetical protein